MLLNTNSRPVLGPHDSIQNLMVLSFASTCPGTASKFTLIFASHQQSFTGCLNFIVPPFISTLLPTYSSIRPISSLEQTHQFCAFFFHSVFFPDHHTVVNPCKPHAQLILFIPFEIQAWICFAPAVSHCHECLLELYPNAIAT
jgi:hypothetical protein